MAQYRIYSLRENLVGRASALSDAIHACSTSVLGLPADKRFHRFIPLECEFFVPPADRSGAYTIIEVSMFEGRSVETKKALIRALFAALAPLGISAQDLEITIFETPKSSWGIRGLPGDELVLNYKVEK